MLFEEFATRTIASIPIREKTRANYRSVFRCHLRNSIGQLRLDEITRSNIQNILKDLPPQTASTTLALIKTIYREAIARELVAVSPALGVKSQQIIVSPRKFLTWDEVRDTDFGKWTPQVHFLALHGLRWGEASALSSSDIRGGRIYVNKSLHGATKSRSGTRVVPLVGQFYPMPKSPKTLRKVLAPHGVHIHSLRHTYAYLLKTQGVHVTTAQRLLGHADPKVTMAVYTQVLDQEIDDVGVILARVS